MIRRLPHPRRDRPWWAWVLAVVALVPIVLPGPYGPLSEPDVLAWLLTTVIVVAGGWVLAGRPGQRRNAVLLLAQAVVNGLVGLDATGWGAWPFLQYLLGPINVLLLGVLLLRWPGERMQTRPEQWAARYAWASLLTVGLLVSMTWDPRWGVGYTGSAWWPTVLRVRTLNIGLIWAHDVNQFLLLVVFLVLIARKLRRAAGPERAALAPVAVSAVALAGFGVPRLVLNAFGIEVPYVVPLLEHVSMLAVPVAVLTSAAVRRVRRALAVEALLHPSRLPDPPSIRDALARALGDRDLVLALWSPDLGRYLTTEGAPAEIAADGRWAVDVSGAGGSAVARVLVDRRLAGSRDLVEEVLHAAGVALDNARLQAEVRARQREAEESSTQLSRARDAERSLSRLFPGGLLDRLRTDPDVFSRTERLTVTVLMSDIRGYTGIAETTAPADLAHQLDQHRRAMNDVLLTDGGTVMQYVGDAVLAVFGAPEPQQAHEEHALRAADAMHQAQARLDAEWAARGLPPFSLGIGICTGEVAAGFLGSEQRAEYTVVGDAVNLAARLTDAARPGGTTLASAATVRGATAHWHAVALPPLQVKGRAAAVSAFRLDAADVPSRTSAADRSALPTIDAAG